ncbi:hypothetical protein OG552_13995 [Streptomyces sp. NBC_01476]|uniref:hypothetical protein n=1 Tax=Streptomyces sp. NBC_01476 TaxID=2903881 RepID=UPI002E3344FD|nr:hypothetical protein [Streptomyces sp. NBC_01476]
MGNFDQFKDQADDVAEKAKDALGNKRGKAAGADRPQRDRDEQRDGRERRSDFDDDMRDGMDSESDERGSLA